MLEHRGSAARQHALTERAVTLGRGRDQIEVIGEDRAECAQTAEGRPGFQRLPAEGAGRRIGSG